MKTKLFFYALILITMYSHAQQNYSTGDIIKLTSTTKHSSTNNNKRIFDPTTKKINWLEKGIKFEIISKVGTKYLLRPLYFDPLEDSDGKRDLAEYYNNTIFEVEEAELLDKSSIEIIPDGWSIGLITLPFKFRPQGDRSFSTEFNLDFTLTRYLKQFFSTDLFWQVGAGLGSIGLNSVNSNLSADEAQDIATLSILSGVMLQYKKVQAGLYFGVDQINNQEKYGWENNGNLWFGFGVGYELFKVSLGKGELANKNN